jgi:acyl-CoA reductase-like NAD-dependent aldehyde dehydrogenase
MSTETRKGTPPFPLTPGKSEIEPSTTEIMDHAVQDLQAHKDEWVAVPVNKRISILDDLIKDFSSITPRWVAAGLKAKGIASHSPYVGEEWMTAAWAVVRNLRLLRQALIDIETYGRPHIPGPIKTLPNGQVVAQVFPQTVYDRLFFTGIQAEIWMQPGVNAEELAQTQALAYQEKQHTGKVALVLGAGNVASIGPLDILYKMLVEDMVVIYKANPVNAYLGPLLAEGFRTLIEPGYLRLVYGGAAEGTYLCHHPDIHEIHITGSDKTFDAIVFGTGPAGAERKAQNRPQLSKRITGELGNVSPLIVVPGPWSKEDLAYQAEHIVSTLINNAGFNCNATRLIIQAAEWPQRSPLLQAIRETLAQTPLRQAYYPGALDRQQAFVKAHPNAIAIGQPGDGQQPWTLITDVEASAADDICFTTEAFCGLFAETALTAPDVVAYLQRAVEFCNNQLWGSLSSTIIIHPQSLKDPAIAAALEQAITELRYGSIGVNYWGGASYALGVTTWGAFPGHATNDIQSGTGVVHNALMFSRPQKSVIRAPFRSPLKPPWFASQGQVATRLFPKLTAFEAAPSPWKVPGIVASALQS